MLVFSSNASDSLLSSQSGSGFPASEQYREHIVTSQGILTVSAPGKNQQGYNSGNEIELH